MYDKKRFIIRFIFINPRRIYYFGLIFYSEVDVSIFILDKQSYQFSKQSVEGFMQKKKTVREKKLMQTNTNKCKVYVNIEKRNCSNEKVMQVLRQH
jgi:hypothetical protein